MDRNVETLAKRVKLRRKQRGLSQGALAEASGLKQPDISKIELGLIQKTTAIARLADALGVSAKWLEFGTGSPEDPQPAELASEQVSLTLTDDAEVQLMMAMRTLMPDDRQRISAEIFAKAEEMRRHAEFIMRNPLTHAPYYQAIGRTTRLKTNEPASPAPKPAGKNDPPPPSAR